MTVAAGATTSETPNVEDDAVEILRQLIRIDTTNTGEPEGTVGEAIAAEYVESLLAGCGYELERFETTSGKRQGVYVRVPGRDTTRPALLLHGHLDVVPAIASDWSVPPFAADEIDGMIWGRGAVDMKDMDAMLIALVRHWAATGYVPPREIVLILTPDEEAGGHHGAHWIVENRPDMLAGVAEAVGEVGGFSVTVADDQRLYLVQTAEKGLAWMRLTAGGTGGHGSMLNDDNAITELARAVTRVGDHRFPIVMTDTMRACAEALAEAFGVPFDPADPSEFLAALGPMARIVGATMSNTVNPTMLSSGIKANVIPDTAQAVVDGRFLPGQEEEFLAAIDALIGDRVSREFVHHDIALETPFDGPLIEAMSAALAAEDPGSRAIPYIMSGGTDAKAWSLRGIRCFGFVPLQLPPDLDFPAMFHGIDERVPVASVRFGVRVLQRFIDAS